MALRDLLFAKAGGNGGSGGDVVVLYPTDKTPSLSDLPSGYNWTLDDTVANVSLSYNGDALTFTELKALKHKIVLCYRDESPVDGTIALAVGFSYYEATNAEQYDNPGTYTCYVLWAGEGISFGISAIRED